MAAGVLCVVSADGGTSQAFHAAWGSGVATIGVWALARELDPDNPSSAGLAAGLAIPAWVLFGVPDLLAIFALVMTARVLLRSSGRAPHFWDFAILFGLAVGAARTSPGWLLALVLAFAVARDRTLDGAPSHGARLTALAIAAGATSLAVRTSDVPSGLTSLIPVVDPLLPSIALMVMVGAGFLAAITTHPYHPVSDGDLSTEPLSAKRLLSARRIALVGAVFVVLVNRQAGMVATAPLWVAWIAIALVTRRIVPLPLGPDLRHR